MKFEYKYAPKNLSDVIYPNEKVKAAIMKFANPDFEGGILMHGPTGVGKTKVSGILMKMIGGNNAISENNFEKLLARDDVTGYLRRCVDAAKLCGQEKYFLVFDEFDLAKKNTKRLSTAMDSIGGDLVVIITTNHPTQIDVAIRDRCEMLNFHAITADAALARAQYILNAESVTLPDQQVLSYLKKYENSGSIRQYMRMLENLNDIVKNGGNLPK
jgi:replication-associated recombination protein RarA